MFSKRFFLTLGLLTLSLVALATGINASLDHMTKAADQNSFAIYDGQGRTLLAYNGSLVGAGLNIHPSAIPLGPRFLHRT
jgi:hypothetical protein